MRFLSCARTRCLYLIRSNVNAALYFGARCRSSPATMEGGGLLKSHRGRGGRRGRLPPPGMSLLGDDAETRRALQTHADSSSPTTGEAKSSWTCDTFRLHHFTGDSVGGEAPPARCLPPPSTLLTPPVAECEGCSLALGPHRSSQPACSPSEPRRNPAASVLLYIFVSLRLFSPSPSLSFFLVP